MAGTVGTIGTVGTVGTLGTVTDAGAAGGTEGQPVTKLVSRVVARSKQRSVSFIGTSAAIVVDRLVDVSNTQHPARDSVGAVRNTSIV